MVLQISIPKFNSSAERSWFELEDKEREAALKKGLEENCGFYMKFGGLYLGSKLIPSLFLTCCFLGDLLLAGTIWKTYATKDMEPLSECCHFLTMITNMGLITTSFLYYRQLIQNLVTAMGFGFYDYGDTVDPETRKEIDDILKTFDDEKKFGVKAFKWLILVCSGTLVMKVMVGYIRFYDTIDGEGGAVTRKHTVPFWFAYSGTWPGYLFGCFLCYSMHFMTTNNVLGYILSVISIATEITAQFRVLHLSLRRVSVRANYIYQCRYGYIGTVVDENYVGCVKDALKTSVKHHIVLLQVCKDLSSLLSLPLFTVMFSSALLLCMSGFLLIEETVPVVAKLTSVVFVVTELLYGYLFCLYGNNITVESEAVGDQLYEDDWKHISATVKPYLTVINLMSKKPSVLYAMGLFEVNLVAFSGVLRSTYSYFNFMLTTKSG